MIFQKVSSKNEHILRMLAKLRYSGIHVATRRFPGCLAKENGLTGPKRALLSLLNLSSEAAHVREQDIDFAAGTVTITATAHHKPKNRASYRTVPVASMPLRALRVVLSGLKVRHPLG